MGLLIGIITEIYTSADYNSVKRDWKAVRDRSGDNDYQRYGCRNEIDSGAGSSDLCRYFCGIPVRRLYGIALAAVGMLSTTAITVAVDQSRMMREVLQMAGLDESVRQITDKLDSVGNTTAAIGKGFASVLQP